MLSIFNTARIIETAKVKGFDIRPTRKLEKVDVGHAKTKNEPSHSSQKVTSTMLRKIC
jgi:hypothetical protein